MRPEGAPFREGTGNALYTRSVSTSQQADPMIGRLVDGRYRVRARIARGGMATVYLATDLRLERRVALKVMHAHLSDDQMFQSRFIQEARAAARLADPHVVNVFDQGQDSGLGYLVMEYLPGVTLREYLRERRRLPIADAIRVMDATLSGLAAAHRAGIIHRDVKPENVLIAQDGRIKIGDFGLARASSANTATGQQLLGTIAYLAPELVTRGTADARSDIYALGIMLYEMLAGEQPYKGEQPMQIAYQHATDSVPRPSAKNPGVPEQLDELVLWATEKEPDERPADAQVMLDRLREIEQQLGIAPLIAATTAPTGVPYDDEAVTGEFTMVLPDATTGPTAPVQEADNATKLRRALTRRRTRGAWLVALVLALTAVAGGVGWYFGSGPGSMVAVPDVAGQDFAQASAAIEELSLVAVQGDVFDIDVEPGIAVGSDPEPGSRLDKGAEVMVLISQGPRPVQLTSLTGLPQEDATAAAQAENLRVSDEVVELFRDEAPGTVVAVRVTPRDGGDTVNCDAGCDAHEDDTVSFFVSVGPVPDVTGLNVGEATSRLNDAGMEVSGDQQRQTSETLAADLVIGIAERGSNGSWRVGETVTLIVSDGPPLFPIPNVVGMTRDGAKAALEEAGFQYEYNGLWDAVLDAVTEVEAQDPGPDTYYPRGTVVSMQIQVTI